MSPNSESGGGADAIPFPENVLGSIPDGQLLWHLGEVARRLLLGSFLGDFEIQIKRNKTDYVTSVDTATEHALRAILGRERPDDAVLGEEEGFSGVGERRWVIDPLDGTANFSRGRPNWGTSIALTDGEVTLLGLVVEPLVGRAYVGVAGRGAWLVLPSIVQKLLVSQQDSLDDAVGSIGFSNTPALRRRQTMLLNALSDLVLDVRPYGSAALDLCHVADGSHDFYYESSLEPWDFLAGALIVQEAGGSVQVDHGAILATNGCLHSTLNSTLGSLKGEILPLD